MSANDWLVCPFCNPDRKNKKELFHPEYDTIETAREDGEHWLDKEGWHFDMSILCERCNREWIIKTIIKPKGGKK